MVSTSGEATLAFVEWCNGGKKLFHESLLVKDRPSIAPSRRNLIAPIALGPEFPRPKIIAADPVNVIAYYLCFKLAHLSSS